MSPNQKTAPKIKQIAEVALVVQDLERSRRFYTDVLGLGEFHYEALKPGTGVTFHVGNGYIGLWLPGEWPRMNPHINMNGDLGGKAHIVFYIDPADADAALENLRRHNVKFWGPRYNQEGEMHIDFEDPDGHMLEYWSRKRF
jgi:catechol 2,3-dioxygenase-like lactoylglutathione lyase family enzyme